jgi:hypothetical protein
MVVRVREVDGGYRIDGGWDGRELANSFLAHLSGRGFSPATLGAYAFDVVNLARFASDIDAFIVTLGTHRDRAMVLAMLPGGLRSAEVRGLLLANVDMGRRRLRVIGKGVKERHVAGAPSSSRLGSVRCLRTRPASRNGSVLHHHHWQLS